MKKRLVSTVVLVLLICGLSPAATLGIRPPSTFLQQVKLVRTEK